MKKTLIFGLVFFFGLLRLQAQTTQQSRSTYAEKAQQLNLHKNSDFYYNHVNLDKIEKLKAAGFDIYDVDRKTGPPSYKEGALLSDVIVIGTIISKEYHVDKNVVFHSTYKIEVEAIQKGQNVPSIIDLNMSSGMYGESYISYSNERELFIGDKALFYLNYVDFAGIAEAIKNGLLQQTVNVDAKNTMSNFTLSNKFSIRHNSIFNYENKKVEKLPKVLNTIKKINVANQ